MTHPVKGIDHCFALVDDLDGAARQYAALGFTLSPRGLHSPAKGTANYTMMFPHDYFELLGVVEPTEMNASRRALLSRSGEGLHAIACRIDDAEQAARDLAGLGIVTENLSHFSRPVPLPDGGEGTAAFSTVSFTQDETPRGILFMCQHRTPETVWIPELLDHPNKVSGLAAVLALSDDPATEADRFARLWDKGRTVKDGPGMTVETGLESAPLILLTRDSMQALYPEIDLSATATGAFTALRVVTTDPDAARACLDTAGIRPIETATGFAVSPEHAAGVVVEFTPR